jgi:cytochrome c biogenesis protein CcmG, thiol:disulfide interchange protein DsbE
MKKIALTLIACVAAFWLPAQQSSIPDVDLRDMDGNIISTLQITTPGIPTLLIFWKSTSGKCCDNLEILQEAWDDTLSQTGIKMIAICVDCNGSWSHVKPLVNGNRWDFDTYVDVNGDFKRAMAVSEVPCTMLFDTEQNLVCRYNSACMVSHEFVCKNIFDHLKAPVTTSYYEAGE